MRRLPEPELMDSEEQTRAYAEADFSESNSLFTQRFLETFTDLGHAGRMVDLGCGPGDITLRLADALPGWQVLGLDAGKNMLRRADEARAIHPAAGRVDYRLSHLPDPTLPSAAWDAVVSNSLLHHLPDPGTLWDSVRSLARPGAAVQVMDLMRPDSEDEARRLVAEYAGDAPPVLQEDFFHSLLAAYTVEEVSGQLIRSGLERLRVEAASDRHLIVGGRLAG